MYPSSLLHPFIFGIVSPILLNMNPHPLQLPGTALDNSAWSGELPENRTKGPYFLALFGGGIVTLRSRYSGTRRHFGSRR